MPTKRSFADFQNLGKDHDSPQQTSFVPLPSASILADATRSCIYWQDTAEPCHESPRSTSNSSRLLRRHVSLPTPCELRKLSHLTLLTSANLRAMDPSHVPTLMSPDRTTTSGRSQSSISTDIASADDGPKMTLRGLLDCSDGKDRLAQKDALRDAVQQIFGGEPASVMKLSSAQAFTKKLSKIQKQNGLTIAARLMPFLLKPERTVFPSWENDDSVLLYGKEVNRMALKLFELDHLDWSIDQDSARNSVPFPASETDPPSVFGVKNPRPNITFGFEPSTFDNAQQRALLTLEPEPSGGIISPFFTIQWKGFQGSMQLAKDQARQDGADMVHSRRKVIERAGVSPKTDELDAASMAFTCVINAEAAHLHIHWAEDVEGKTDWLMAVVKRYHLEEESDFVDLRRALYNILDWGLSERLALVKQQVDLYRERESTYAGI